VVAFGYAAKSNLRGAGADGRADLHRYAARHPELELETYELPQVPGNISRSGHLYGVTESFVKSKSYLLPLAILEPIGIGGVAALGVADHRYDGKTDARVGGGFFFRPETAETAATTSPAVAEP
jgi:hypothetical protein